MTQLSGGVGSAFFALEALIFCLTSVSVNVIKHLKKAKIGTTRANIQAIKTGIKTFELDVGRRPTTLQELVKEGDENWPGPFLDAEEIPKDGWNNDFRYSLKGKRFEIRSAGPDESFDTEDDITK